VGIGRRFGELIDVAAQLHGTAGDFPVWDRCGQVGGGQNSEAGARCIGKYKGEATVTSDTSRQEKRRCEPIKLRARLNQSTGAVEDPARRPAPGPDVESLPHRQREAAPSPPALDALRSAQHAVAHPVSGLFHGDLFHFWSATRARPCDLSATGVDDECWLRGFVGVESTNPAPRFLRQHSKLTNSQELPLDGQGKDKVVGLGLKCFVETSICVQPGQATTRLSSTVPSRWSRAT